MMRIGNEDFVRHPLPGLHIHSFHGCDKVEPSDAGRSGLVASRTARAGCSLVSGAQRQPRSIHSGPSKTSRFLPRLCRPSLTDADVRSTVPSIQAASTCVCRRFGEV
ncbi:hypothetical protein VTK56DRAFT_9019 [Thermocarpiscus australiensis]